MLSLKEIESHYQFPPGKLLDIMVEIHNQVAEIAPNATERLDRWGITYFDSSRGGPVSAGIPFFSRITRVSRTSKKHPRINANY